MRTTTAAVLCLCGVLATACGKKEAPAPAEVIAAPAPAPAPVLAAPAAAPPALPPADSGPAAPAGPVASSDPDEPTPLPAKLLKGVGLKKNTSYYYAFNAGAGIVKLTATAKNAPSGATNALQFALYDTRANRLCFESHGNTTSDKTITINCTIDKAQPVILRLDLGEETIDYALALEGPVELPPAQSASAARPAAGAGSTDIDEPTRLETSRVKGNGVKQAVSYYYAFNALPGELTVTGDGRNESAATTEALRVSLLTRRSEKICDMALGNTTLDKRVVMNCKFDKRTPVILRLDLSPETIDYRVKFEGPHDFDPYAAPKEVTIALDSAVLFDTGKSELKPEAKQTLHEAADRVKKFPGASVMISGHTDDVGNEASNKALSEKRAAAVRDYFVNTASVPSAGLAVKGFGKSQPVADNRSESGRARNRRVDVVIKPAGQS